MCAKTQKFPCLVFIPDTEEIACEISRNKKYEMFFLEVRKFGPQWEQQRYLCRQQCSPIARCSLLSLPPKRPKPRSTLPPPFYATTIPNHAQSFLKLFNVCVTIFYYKLSSLTTDILLVQESVSLLSSS